MPEEKEQQLEETAKKVRHAETEIKQEVSEETIEVLTEGEVTTEIPDEITTKKVEVSAEPSEVVKEESNTETEIKQDASEETVEVLTEDENITDTSTENSIEKVATKAEDASESTKDVIEEIDESNAEDAEDKDNHHRHQIPVLDYHSMSMENLVGELQRLVRNEKVQAIKKHVDGIKHEFDLKFQEFLEHKKEEFITNGGNEIDFRYNSVTKRQFNEVYQDYREKRNQHYKGLEKNHKENMAKRLDIIEQLKGLINVEEDINTTYKNFRELQETWRSAGPIPRNNYNDVWRTYHHHIEIFYDFLHLNRELRDLDFKHNLEEKQKLVEKAEALVDMKDLGQAFRELQTLHQIWKEEIGPVGKEHREEIWERFSNATKAMHRRRQDHYAELDKQYEVNLEKKKEIIASINTIVSSVAESHKILQQQIKQIEELRDAFFKAGKVPQKVNEKTWAEFKDAVRAFNRNKNSFYKNLKKGQQENLDKKRKLLEIAISLKESEEWDTATQEMKRIQGEWKKIGHVPRKYSDKLWVNFKNACNHYFDRLHASKNSERKEETDNLDKKLACLDKLKDFQLGNDRDKDLAQVKKFIEEWKSYGHVPFKKKSINQKFNKILDAIFKKLNVSRQESEILKYGNKIKQLAKSDNGSAISNERTFIRRKISESKNELRQLENNMQFFSNASEDNPLVKDVIKNINTHKDALATWQEKLKKLNIMENKLNKESEVVDESEVTSSEEE